MSSSTSYFDKVTQAAEFLRGRIGEMPIAAIVLGSGLGDFADSLGDAVAIRYEDIPHWPASKVMGHAGKLVVGTSRGRRILVLAGRVHFYEGHDLLTVTFATRVLWKLGISVLVLTNAAGGINTKFAQGALMVIDDHINFMGSNPLIGPNEDRFGFRFPDMTEVYAPRLRALADASAAAIKLPIEHGVYVAVHGPSYETPAEIRAFRIWGADAVGMSTAPEAIAAKQMRMDVLGISCITNMAAGVLPQPLHHDEVMETAARVKGQFIALLEGVVERL